MAKKATVSSKASPQKKKEAPESVASKKTRPEVKTLDEAKELVEKSYKHADKLEYTVLANGHVFYGINNKNAQRVAENYGLKFFEVKF